MQPRGKRCVQSTDGTLRSLGQFYVEKTFTPKQKHVRKKMVANLIEALREDLTTLS